MFSFSLASLRDWHSVCVARRGNGDVKFSSTCVSRSASCISDPTMPCGYPGFLVVVSPMTFLRYPRPSFPAPTLARSNSPLPLADRRRPANRSTHGWCPLARAGARLANRWHAKCDMMRHQVAPARADVGGRFLPPCLPSVMALSIRSAAAICPSSTAAIFSM